jgi:hypothetical protein
MIVRNSQAPPEALKRLMVEMNHLVRGISTIIAIIMLMSEQCWCLLLTAGLQRQGHATVLAGGG